MTITRQQNRRERQTAGHEVTVTLSPVHPPGGDLIVAFCSSNCNYANVNTVSDNGGSGTWVKMGDDLYSSWDSTLWLKYAAANEDSITFHADDGLGHVATYVYGSVLVYRNTQRATQAYDFYKSKHGINVTSLTTDALNILHGADLVLHFARCNPGGTPTFDSATVINDYAYNTQQIIGEHFPTEAHDDFTDTLHWTTQQYMNMFSLGIQAATDGTSRAAGTRGLNNGWFT